MIRPIPRFTSRLALWSQRLAFFGLLMAALGIYAGRTDAIPIIQSLAVVAAALLAACIAAILAASAFVVIWRTGADGLKSAYIGWFISLILLIYPVYLAIRALSLPVLNDISTDLVDPPLFDASIAMRRGHNPATFRAGFASAQRNAYPDIQTVTLDLNADESFQLVTDVLKQLRWSVTQAVPPIQRTRDGHVEILQRSVLLHLPVDIVIRIHPSAQETRIDIRSSSRFGRHDFGTNAAYIRQFIEILVLLARDR